MWILSGVFKITELTLDLFENNYKLFAKKLVDVETDLVIRAIILKNNEVIFNYSIRIQGTDNVHDATIAAANKVCNLFLGITLKGDTIVCSLAWELATIVHVFLSLEMCMYLISLIPCTVVLPY